MEKLNFYIDGAWVDPATPSTLGIVNPATEETFAQISLGSRVDVDRAAKAARRAAVAARSTSSLEPRLICANVSSVAGLTIPRVDGVAGSTQAPSM